MWRRRRISWGNKKFHQQASVLYVRCFMRYALGYRQNTDKLLHIYPPGYVRTDWDYSYRTGCTCCVAKPVGVTASEKQTIMNLFVKTRCLKGAQIRALRPYYGGQRAGLWGYF
jgi:hypothetical protein